MSYPIEGVELGKIDEASGDFVFFSKQYKDFADIVRKNMPADTEFGEPTKQGAKEDHLGWIPVYLADLEGNGKKEIFLMAPDKISGQRMLMIFDEYGKLLDQLPFESIWPSYLDFGIIRKGEPICFGLHWCALAAGVCSWEFYIFYDGKIKPALNGDDVEEGDFTPPVFTNIDIDAIKGNPSGEPTSSFRNYQWINPYAESQKHLKKGKEYYHAKDYGNAIQEYLAATSSDYQNYEAWGLMGYAYLRQRGDNYAYEAAQALQRSVRIKPDYLMGHYNLALAYWAWNEPKFAVQEIAKVIQLDPKYEAVINKDPQFSPILKSDVYQTWKKTNILP
jgi:tetratricopeptide (TPR) repeat protein